MRKNKSLLGLVLCLFFWVILPAQNEKAFDFYSAGVRAGYVYDYGEAIYNYSEAIKLKPDYTMAYYNRGVAYFKNKENDNAINDFRMVISQDSSYVDAYYFMGEALLNKMMIAQAMDLFQLA
jgi:tetratricopeptide (TPR) repeat protein